MKLTKSPSRLLGLSALAIALSVGTLRADEGMWTFDNVPTKKMQAKYGFAPDQKWLDHVRLSVVRFPGGTGSFVSKDGLVLTNHHVGRGSIQQVSDKDHDFVKNGFYAPTREQEVKVPGLILYTLMDMLNVTERVNGAVKKGGTDKEALKAREVELGRIVGEMQKKTGLHCEQVDLYQGGEYWIYSYKKHDDVRLVFAPEEQIAFFGGDPDNFTFPRHDIDFSIFRVYENGKPYTPPSHLQWTSGGLKAGDLTFVTGHPGSTARLQTYAQMSFARDTSSPLQLKTLARRIKVLQEYAAQSPENARQVNTQIFGLQNSQKAITGYWSGLKDKEAMAKIEKAEKELRSKAAADPKLAFAKDSWAGIEAAEVTQKSLIKEAAYVNTRNSSLLGTALVLVRMPDEAAKPDEKRLPEFKDARLPALKMQMGIKRPFYKDMEIALFTDGLKEAQEQLGANHPFVKAMLGGKSPADVAKAAVEGSKLSDPAARKDLMDGGKKAVDASTDPMILLAKKLDPISRATRKNQEEKVDAILNEQGGRIARARFVVFGKETYPDATFTLRITYGDVRSYDANGTKMQPFTTLAGLYDRAWGWGPTAERGAWELPPKWVEHQKDVDMTTPLDFIHAVDIIGGNSGSPVVDKKGELVGLIFDGNIESLPGRYFYDEKVNRAVSVDARAIQEALKKVYGAGALADELAGK